MPILREHRAHYSVKAGWPTTRATIRARSGGTCECTGQCGARHEGGRCRAPDRQRIRRQPDHREHWTLASGNAEDGGVLVILTVAHVNQIPGDDRPENLLDLCQYCHTRMDKPHQWRHRRARLRRAQLDAGQQELALRLAHPSPAGPEPAHGGPRPQE